ncbi:MAG: methyltransferase domain-containing protein [Clostridia bacterium]|nr:methyltransferase domain-containing protein [Clostridia bacterium]
MGILLCPICKSELNRSGSSFVCDKGHCFDIAKEGYVNLLTGSKSGSLIGDNRDMARSRKSFLDKGYFSHLSDKLCSVVAEIHPKAVLDICCGEGYYTQALAQHCKADVYGFDISKEMIRLAAKRKCNTDFFVANMADIPIADDSIDCAVHLFAPLCEKEFLRVIKQGGYLISVCPGAKHLWEMKSVLYETPYENEELAPELPGLTLAKVLHAGSIIHLENGEDIEALFKMTPYYYHTPSAGKEKLSCLSQLKTQTDFYIRIYRKD